MQNHNRELKYQIDSNNNQESLDDSNYFENQYYTYRITRRCRSKEKDEIYQFNNLINKNKNNLHARSKSANDKDKKMVLMNNNGSSKNTSSKTSYLSEIHNLDRSMKGGMVNHETKIDISQLKNSNKTLTDSKESMQDSNGLLNHPKYAQFFKKRVCNRCVKDPVTERCVGCQLKIDEGLHKNVANAWFYQTCTELSPTDAYGKLTFPGSHSKTASYIRVQNETKTKDMIQYMYSPEGWNLQKPQLILSVTGGAQKFTIPHRMKKAFKRGLIKAAASTGAWIITGGTNTGVMRLVGEAVADEFHTCDLTVLGIATWGKIAFREKMIKNLSNTKTSVNLDDINKESQQIIFNDKKKRMKKMILKNLELENRLMYQVPLFYAQQEVDSSENKKDLPKNTDVLLDPNHTHFILVDDGSVDRFGVEIEFRAHLEAELRKGKSLKYYESKRNMKKRLNRVPWQKSDDEDDDSQDEESSSNESVPMILIVVQGGPNTLITVEESLKQAVPVLILADSKGCADLIANACSIIKPEDSHFEKLIVESTMFDVFRNKPEYKSKIREATERLKYIISKMSDNLINIFRLDSEEGGSDIELTILRAFLNSRKNKYYENLKLALQWNRSDIAKTDIFTGEEEFKSHQLAHLMEMALVQNKPQFVELLLENGLNLKSFLTVRRLCFLYNSQKVHSDAKKAPLFQLYKKKYSSEHSNCLITFKGLLRFLKDFLFEDFEPTFLPNDLDYGQMERFLDFANKRDSSDFDAKDSTAEFTFGKNEVLNPEQNLFLWALLLNRIEIAILFWQIGEHQICSALFASNLLKSMSKRLSDLEKETKQCADEFEEMAIGVLNIFDATTDDLINGVILLRKIPFYNLDCLQMAVEADCQKFVALSSVQNLLTDIWFGKITLKSGIKASIKFAISCLSLGLLAPFLVFERREKLTNLSDRESTLKKLATYNKKKNITNLLRGYLTNNEINMDKKDANLLPGCCSKEETSSSSDEETSDESTDGYMSKIHDASKEVEYKSIRRIKKKSKKRRKSKLATYWDRYKHFVKSPRVHFVYDAFCYSLFLLLFSYMILCEFTYYETVEVENEVYQNVTHSTDLNKSISLALNNVTYEKKLETLIKAPSWIEYLLIYWMIAFMAEEARQYFFGDAETKVLKNKLLHYFANNWNYLDISGCLVFIIGMSLRFISLNSTESIFVAARIILCIDLCIWYLRLLHISVVFKSLGPKLVMIQKMVRDLMFFISIIAIFVCAFGVTTQATLYPGNKLDLSMLRSVLNKAYWPIYGEMKILDELDDCPSDDPTKSCPETSGIAFSYVALMIYMIIANVLLINLLIAMFSSTFEDVQDKTDEIWKFQRYRLVFEYYDSPIFPPPLNFLAYFISLIQYMKNKSPKSKLLNNQIDKSEHTVKDDVDILLDRERKYAEEFVRKGKFKLRETTESRLKWNIEKLETLEQKLNEVIETRFKESNQLCVAINWIMSELDSDRKRAPFIQNVNSGRKLK